MKGVISILLRDVYQKIPKAILNEAFLPEQNGKSLDKLIQDKVIVEIVLDQCNYTTGQMKKIPLRLEYAKPVGDDLSHLNPNANYSIYVIPPEARENRGIAVALDISYPSVLALNNSYPHNILEGRSVANGMDEMLSSMTHLPTAITPTPMLIDGAAGIIRLSPPMMTHTDWIFSCMLNYDKDFTNISPNMVKPLTDSVVLATKAFIYNELWIKINQGYLQGGLQLDAIKSIIEGYADADEKFEESITKLRGAAMFSKENLVELISMML